MQTGKGDALTYLERTAYLYGALNNLSYGPMGYGKTKSDLAQLSSDVFHRRGKGGTAKPVVWSGNNAKQVEILMRMIHDGLDQLDREVKRSFSRLQERRVMISEKLSEFDHIKNSLNKAKLDRPVNPVAIQVWQTRMNTSLQQLETLAKAGNQELTEFFSRCNDSFQNARVQSGRIKKLLSISEMNDDDYFTNTELLEFLGAEDVTNLSKLLYQHSRWAGVPLTSKSFDLFLREGLKRGLLVNYNSLGNGGNFKNLQIWDDFLFKKVGQKPSGFAPGRVLKGLGYLGTALTFVEWLKDDNAILDYISEFHEVWSSVLGPDLYNIYFRDIVEAASMEFREQVLGRGLAGVVISAKAALWAATACAAIAAPTGPGALAAGAGCFVVSAGVGLGANYLTEKGFDKLNYGDEEAFVIVLNSALELGYLRMQQANKQIN